MEKNHIVNEGYTDPSLQLISHEMRISNAIDDISNYFKGKFPKVDVCGYGEDKIYVYARGATKEEYDAAFEGVFEYIKNQGFNPRYRDGDYDKDFGWGHPNNEEISYIIVDDPDPQRTEPPPEILIERVDS